MINCSIVINTCIDYYGITLPPLLESFEKAKVPKECIFIVVGDCDSNRNEVIDDIHYYFRRYCNIDNNGLLWITQERPNNITNWILYCHDTCTVIPEFWKKTCDIIQTFKEDTDCVKLIFDFSMGMGFYKKNWLFSTEVKNYMRTIMNFDQSKKQIIKDATNITEDTLFKFAEKGHGNCTSLDNIYNVIEKDRKMYGTDIPRIVEYYENPGIYKLKANWKFPVFNKL